MVVLLLALLLVETLTGVYVANDIVDEGPLTEIVPARAADAIASAHAIVWDMLLAAILLHVLAIAGFAAIKGQNLLRPMVTEQRSCPQASSRREPAVRRERACCCWAAPSPQPCWSTSFEASSALRAQLLGGMT